MAKLVNGQTIYVNAKNCKLLNKPSIDGAALAVIQPKTAVTWLAKAPNTNDFHQVRYGNLIGFIYYACLQQAPVTDLSLKNVDEMKSAVRCKECDGRGWVLKGSEIHPVCPVCDGKGKIFAVFASSGNATKA